MSLGGWLEPIQSYCLIKGLPPLTVLVVSDSNGMPGSGFVAAAPASVPEAQTEVFRYDWTSMPPPKPEELAQAVAVDSWHPAATTPYATRDAATLTTNGRREFIGRVATPSIRDRYFGRSVASYFHQGQQNPVVYVNC